MSYKILLPYVITAVTAIGYSAGNNVADAHTDDNDNKNKIETKVFSATYLNNTQKNDSIMDRIADSIFMVQTIPTRAEQNGKSVVYVYTDGRKVMRNGGTRAWRNNNPGNLRYYEFAKNNGAIGVAGDFAVFPNEETGMQALYKLLQTESYKNLTIAAALKRYDKLNWRSYTQKLTRATGLSANIRLSSLNAGQLDAVAQAIRRVEGWTPGQEQKIDVPQYAMVRAAQERAR